MSPKLYICILPSKFPLNGSLKGVSRLLPSLDFGYQQLSTGNPPIQALAAEDADLNFRQVQPTRVLGHVVKLQPAQELCGRALTQHIGRAALDLDLVQSALSQQISRLESELSTRLLQRSPKGVTPTEAGLAFFREAELVLRHAEQAARAAQQARLSGSVSVGMAPTTAAVLGLPLIRAMRERYPDVRLHMVESLSDHLTGILNARQLDLAMLFNAQAGRR